MLSAPHAFENAAPAPIEMKPRVRVPVAAGLSPT